MNPASKARIAGLAYLAIIVSAVFSEQIVGNSVVVTGDAAATAANILAREEQWRLATVAAFVTAACDTIVALLLYELFKPVNATASLLAAAFQMVLVAVAPLEILLHIAPLSLLKAHATYLSHFTLQQLQALSYLSLRLHGQAFDISLFFFGIHCLLIGWLISQATFLPRVLGWFLALAGLCYIGNTWARALAPDFASQLYPWAFLVGGLAEAALTLWLVVRGVNSEKWRIQAAAGARE